MHGRPNLRCPRNGQTDGFVFFDTRPAFINQPLDALNKHWEGGEGCSVSPDTGQRSGCTRVSVPLQPFLPKHSRG